VLFSSFCVLFLLLLFASIYLSSWLWYGERKIWKAK
jgi:hypothetical protein